MANVDRFCFSCILAFAMGREEGDACVCVCVCSSAQARLCAHALKITDNITAAYLELFNPIYFMDLDLYQSSSLLLMLFPHFFALDTAEVGFWGSVLY